MEELRGVEKKWGLIGRALIGVRVDEIMYPDSTDCLKEVIRRRLQYVTSWVNIIDALRRAEEPQVADHLKAKYIPGELTTTTSS